MGRLKRLFVVAGFVLLFGVVAGGLVPGVADTAQAAGWSVIGPQGITLSGQFASYGPVSGRITSVALGRGGSIYVGAAGGGVWKSVDGGKSWVPLTDNVFPTAPTESSMAIGALAVDSTGPEDTIYAGTGEINGGESAQYGQGLLKSTDGGKTWRVLGRSSFSKHFIGGIVANGSRLLVATDYGLFRSPNDGLFWGKDNELNNVIPARTPGQAVSGEVFEIHKNPTITLTAALVADQTTVTWTSPALKAGTVYSVAGVGIPFDTTLTVTGSGTTATLSNAATETVASSTLTLSIPTITLTADLTDGQTTVTGLSVSLPVGAVYPVTGTGIPAETDLTVTGSGTTATLSNPATVTAAKSALALSNNKYWATFGDRCRTEAGGIATSDNGGITWKVVYSDRNAGRIGLGVGPGGVAYAAVASCNGGLSSIQKTINGGATWTQIPKTTPGYTDYFGGDPTADDPNGQGNWDNVVAVDPTDASRAVFGGINILATSNGGTSLTDVGRVYTGGFIHPDVHAVAFTAPSSFYVGEDGGLWRTTTANMGGTGAKGDWTNLNGAPGTPGEQGLGITQFYAGSALTPTELLGGTQDNGSPAALPTLAAKLPAMQDPSPAGDGSDTAIDPTPNANTVYTETPNLGINRTTGLGAKLTATLTSGQTSVTGMSVTLPVNTVYSVSGAGISANTRLIAGSGATATLERPATFTGQSTLTLDNLGTAISPCPKPCTEPSLFNAPFVMDPSNPQRLLAGTNRVYETLNARTGGNPGVNEPIKWTPISGTLTRGGALSSIALAPTTLTASLATGQTTVTGMSVTLRASAMYSVTGPGVPANTTLTVTGTGTTGTLSNAATETGERGLTLGGATIFTASSDGAVWRTTNGGARWTDISGNLPTPQGATNPGDKAAFLTQVAVNPANPSQAWVTISYLGKGNLWYTNTAGRAAADGGTDWVDLSGTGTAALPDAPALAVVERPDTSDIYVGTYYGVWRCSTCGGQAPVASWERLGGSDLATGALPTVEVDGLSQTADNKTLMAWTHGRGVWQIRVPPG